MIERRNRSALHLFQGIDMKLFVAAVQLVEKTLGDLSQQSIMVIGAGQVAECCVRLLVGKGAGSIFVSSRSHDCAIDLANRYGGNAVCFGYCLFEMREVDVVIVATSSVETLLHHDDIEYLMEARQHRPLLLIDLSEPRNLDPAAGQLESVSLYSIDDLQGMASEGAGAGQGELASCHQIIEAHAAALIEKLDAEEELRIAVGSRPSFQLRPAFL
jgi:glutamyl-tRNA reductase